MYIDLYNLCTCTCTLHVYFSLEYYIHVHVMYIHLYTCINLCNMLHYWCPVGLGWYGSADSSHLCPLSTSGIAQIPLCIYRSDCMYMYSVCTYMYVHRCIMWWWEFSCIHIVAWWVNRFVEIIICVGIQFVIAVNLDLE